MKRLAEFAILPNTSSKSNSVAFEKARWIDTGNDKRPEVRAQESFLFKLCDDFTDSLVQIEDQLRAPDPLRKSF